MGKHRFCGDTAGNRDHRGHWIGPGDPPTVEPVDAPALCAVCGATPEDPECLCKPSGSGERTGTDTGTDSTDGTPQTGENTGEFTGTDTGTDSSESVKTDSDK